MNPNGPGSDNQEIIRPLEVIAPEAWPGDGGRQEARDGFAPRLNKLRLLWRRKWFVAAGTVLGASAGFIYLIFQEPVYQSKATIELLGFNESFMGMNQVDPQAGTGSYGATASNIQTQTRILTSASLLTRVAERVNLEMPPLTSNSQDIFARLRRRLGVAEQEPVQVMRTAVGSAAKSLTARGVGASRLLEISTTSESPEVAANFVNTLASEFISQSTQSRSNASLRTIQWMEGQLEETRTRFEQAEKKLQDFAKKEGLEFVLDQSTLADSKLRQLQTGLSALQADRIAKQSRYDIAKASPIDTLPDILDDGSLKALREKMTALRTEKAQLGATLMSGHPKMQRVDAQLKELDQSLQQEKTNLVRRIQNDYEEALRRERLMSGAYGAQSHAVANQSDKASELGALKREAEMAQQAHNALLQQLNQANMVAAVPTTQVQLIDPAIADPTPVSPVPYRTITSGALLGGAAVYGLFLLIGLRHLKKLETVFASPGHAGLMLEMPELGVIPSLRRERSKSSVRLKWKGSSGMRVSAARQNAMGTHKAALVAWNHRNSVESEAFRLTLTSLLRRMDQSEHRVLVISSSGPGEGKTTISSNVAIAMAESGRRVLLVDGDLRRPRLHRVFAIENTEGLADLIRSPELSIDRLVQPTWVPSLFILPSGACNPDEFGSLLFSGGVSSTLARLRAEYDAVIIDTPPALQLSDARLLGKHADGVALVVRAGTTFRDDVMAVRQSFANDGVPVLGIILNDWDPNHSSREYYSNTYRGDETQYAAIYEKADEV